MGSNPIIGTSKTVVVIGKFVRRGGLGVHESSRKETHENTVYSASIRQVAGLRPGVRIPPSATNDNSACGGKNNNPRNNMTQSEIISTSKQDRFDPLARTLKQRSCARMAKLADALDLGFRNRRFQTFLSPKNNRFTRGKTRFLAMNVTFTTGE